MNRFSNRIEGKSFYFENVKGKVPEWMGTFDYYSEEDKEHKEYLIANDEATLLHIINMGCIELNPWSSTIINLIIRRSVVLTLIRIKTVSTRWLKLPG
nr:hypothetical protein [Chryseobacterium gregarium]